MKESSVSPGTRYLYAEVFASAGATLTLNDAKTGKLYRYELSQVVPERETPAAEGGGSYPDHRPWPPMGALPCPRR